MSDLPLCSERLGAQGTNRQGRRVWLASCWPALKVSASEFGQGPDPVVLLVKAGNVAKHLSARLKEFVLAFHGYFFECFQAVGRKAGADDINAFDTRSAQLGQRLRGVWS